jgi:hypothetical protein
MTLTLCGSDDWFSKSIVTVPADAFSDVCWNINPPDGLAWRVSFELPVAAGVVAAGVLAVVAGDVDPVELLLLDDPHPASAAAPTRQVTDDLRSLVCNGFASDSWAVGV